MNESKKTSSKDSQTNSSNTLLEQLYIKLGMDELKFYLQCIWNPANELP